MGFDISSPDNCMNPIVYRDALLFVDGTVLPDEDGWNYLRIGAALHAVGCEYADWKRWVDANIPEAKGRDLESSWGWLGTDKGRSEFGRYDGSFLLSAARRGGWDEGQAVGYGCESIPMDEPDMPQHESDEDGLPHAVSLIGVFENPPKRPPVLIGTEARGLLRLGHVGLLSAPSKAGKSWCALELCVAVATGTRWLGFPCSKGHVLYVNFEIDGRSAVQRLISVTEAVYQAEGCTDEEFRNQVEEHVRVLNLRGISAATDEFADHIISEAIAFDGVKLVILDPLGMYNDCDENDNGAMKKTMASLNRITRETGASVFCIHHYAKGRAGGKLAIDRFSGAGMIARAPDAVLDLAPLECPDDDTDLGDATAWRMTASLREFRPIEPVNLLFKWPRHVVDDKGALSSWEVQGADAFAEGRRQKRRREEVLRQSRADLLRKAYRDCVAADALTTVNGITGVEVSELWANCGEDAETGSRPTRRTLANWCDSDWSPLRRVNVAEPGRKPAYLYVCDGYDLESEE